MRLWKHVFIFLCGNGSGIFIAQGIFILAQRKGGNFGGEAFIIPLIILLICMGFMFGEMWYKR